MFAVWEANADFIPHSLNTYDKKKTITTNKLQLYGHITLALLPFKKKTGYSSSGTLLISAVPENSSEWSHQYTQVLLSGKWTITEVLKLPSEYSDAVPQQVVVGGGTEVIYELNDNMTKSREKQFNGTNEYRIMTTYNDDFD